jgi:hypothetical protein
MYTFFKPRTYDLLQTLVVKARQWVQALPATYGVPLGQRHRLIPGSVAMAFRVLVHEERATQLLRLDDPYSRSSSWGSSVPRQPWLSDLWRGRIGIDQAWGRLVGNFYGRDLAVGPTLK